MPGSRRENTDDLRLIVLRYVLKRMKSPLNVRMLRKNNGAPTCNILPLNDENTILKKIKLLTYIDIQ